MVIIIDYGMGNLASIANMLHKIGGECQISGDPAVIMAAEKLILPGVGSFDAGMRNLHERGLVDVLDSKVVQENTPLLGICLGMQLLTRGSEEGSLPGLNWIPADTVRFPSGTSLKIPHMGWNAIRTCGAARLYREMPVNSRFYFVHSYHVVCDCPDDMSAVTDYGIEVTASFEKGNIFGVQFHPEKSHKFGMQLLKNFVERV